MKRSAAKMRFEVVERDAQPSPSTPTREPTQFGQTPLRRMTPASTPIEQLVLRAITD
jgi:hypothetical protein